MRSSTFFLANLYIISDFSPSASAATASASAAFGAVAPGANPALVELDPAVALVDFVPLVALAAVALEAALVALAGPDFLVPLATLLALAGSVLLSAFYKSAALVELEFYFFFFGSANPANSNSWFLSSSAATASLTAS